MKEQDVFPDWLVNLMEMSASERAREVKNILEEVACYNPMTGQPESLPTKEGRAILKEIGNASQYRVVGFCPNTMVVPLSSSKKGVEARVWTRPMLLMKHLHSPILMVVGASVEENFYKTSKVSAPKEVRSKKEGEVLSFLSWVHVVSTSSDAQRKALRKVLLDDLLKYGSNRGAQTEKGSALYRAFHSKAFEQIGFSPNVMYLKVKGTPDEMQALFVHPWGTPKLLFRHEGFPLWIITGTDLRLDESIVGEVPANRFSQYVGGLTG